MGVRGIAAGAGMAVVAGLAVFAGAPAAAAQVTTSGGCWVVTGNLVRYHARPGLGAALGELARGTQVNDLSRSQEADGYLWNNVNIKNGRSNVWIASNYLAFSHWGNC